jgi:hypothetical protein
MSSTITEEQVTYSAADVIKGLLMADPGQIALTNINDRCTFYSCLSF